MECKSTLDDQIQKIHTWKGNRYIYPCMHIFCTWGYKCDSRRRTSGSCSTVSAPDSDTYMYGVPRYRSHCPVTVRPHLRSAHISPRAERLIRCLHVEPVEFCEWLITRPVTRLSGGLFWMPACLVRSLGGKLPMTGSASRRFPHPSQAVASA